VLRIVKQCQAVLVGQLRLQKAFEATALMAAAQELPLMEITKPSNATLPQIEVARVRPVDRMTPNPRLSDDVISLMKEF
jgi:hypothetical protein